MADDPLTPLDIPDLDPRVDAHLIGHLTWGQFITFLGIGSVGLVIALLVGSAIGWTTPALMMGLIGMGGLMAWGAIDGPHQWAIRRQFRRRPRQWTVWPGGGWSVPAYQRDDPFWVMGDRVWAMAWLTIPPVAFLDPEDLDAWHRRLATVVRTAAWHRCTVEIGSVQGPGMRDVPPPHLPPVLRRRWQWWIERVAAKSIASGVWVRLSVPGTHRDEAVPHLLAAEQTWQSLAGPGTWHWLSASAAERMLQGLGHPGADYAQWQAVALERVQGPVVIRRQGPSIR